jgi:uncharacterized membrane protein
MLNAIFLSIGSGCRTMTPIAVVCWAAYLGYLPATGWASWTGTLTATVIFTVFAVGEWVGDLLPQTPSRRDLLPALGRIAFGILVASLMWKLENQPVAGGVVIGIVGALIGTVLGYRVRMGLARKIGRDWPVGIAESMLVLVVSIAMVWDMHTGLANAAVHLWHP